MNKVLLLAVFVAAIGVVSCDNSNSVEPAPERITNLNVGRAGGLYEISFDSLESADSLSFELQQTINGILSVEKLECQKAGNKYTFPANKVKKNCTLVMQAYDDEKKRIDGTSIPIKLAELSNFSMTHGAIASEFSFKSLEGASSYAVEINLTPTKAVIAENKFSLSHAELFHGNVVSILAYDANGIAIGHSTCRYNDLWIKDIKLKDDVLTWSPVDNAEKYVIVIKGKDNITLTTCEYEIENKADISRMITILAYSKSGVFARGEI